MSFARKKAEDAGASTGQTFTENAKRCRAELGKRVSAALDAAIQAFEEKDVGRREKFLGDAFDNLGRQTSDLLQELSDADAELNRQQLKTQAMTSKMKLQASRTAAGVDIQNKMAELEASHAEDLKSQIERAKSGGSAELKAAHERVEELEQELLETKAELSRTQGFLELAIKTRDEERVRSDEQLQRAAEEASAMSEAHTAEVARLKGLLKEVTDERDQLQAESKAEVNRQVTAAKKEMSAGLERVVKASKAEADRLQAELDKKAAELEALNVQLQKGRAELSEVRAEMAKRQGTLEELQAQVALGDEAYEKKTEKLRAELQESKEKLQAARKEVDEQLKFARKSAEEKEEAQRRLAESLTRTIAEVTKATRASADECQKQLNNVVERARQEIHAVRIGEREKAQAQLDRLLDELARLTNQLTEAETKWKQAEQQNRTAALMANKLKALREEERNLREQIGMAGREVNCFVDTAERPPQQLTRVLGVYRKVHADIALITEALDQALVEMETTSLENTSLNGKMTQLLGAYRQLRGEQGAITRTLDGALAHARVQAAKRDGIERKLARLLEQFELLGQSETGLRTALRKQHSSLTTAYHRVQAVESELTRAQGAHAEERESLVHAALHALNQLRTFLGQVHAIKPEAARPIDEALVVHNLRHGAPPPGPPPRSSGGGSWVTSSIGAQGAGGTGAPPTTPMPAELATRQQVEATMNRIAETASALVAGGGSLGAISHPGGAFYGGGGGSPLMGGKGQGGHLPGSLSTPNLSKRGGYMSSPWSPGKNIGAHYPGGYADATASHYAQLGVSSEWQQYTALPNVPPKTPKTPGSLRPLTGGHAMSAGGGGVLSSIQPGVLRVPQPGGGAGAAVGSRFRLGTSDGMMLPSPTRTSAEFADPLAPPTSLTSSTTNVLTIS